MVIKVFFFLFYYTNNWGFPVAQRLKPLPAMRETWVRSLGQEDPLEKEMVTHSSILACRIPWTEKPGRLQSTGSQRVRHDWATSLSLSIKLTANSLIFSVEIKVILKLMSLCEDSIFFSLNVIIPSSRKRWSWEQWEEKHSYPLICALGVGVCVCELFIGGGVLAIYWGFVCVCVLAIYWVASMPLHHIEGSRLFLYLYLRSRKLISSLIVSLLKWSVSR